MIAVLGFLLFGFALACALFPAQMMKPTQKHFDKFVDWFRPEQDEPPKRRPPRYIRHDLDRSRD